jgi:solute carrier family 13 (sodium-dependent dicarboxylate transporter), member 2/3/5
MNWMKIAAGPILYFLVYVSGISDDMNLTGALALACWMIFWWISEAVSLYVTALLPLIIGPFSGLLTKSDLSDAYGNSMVFLFLGGFIIARAIEKWNVHRKIASWIVARTGSSPSGVLLGFILATAFLSMWLSNTGTTIMMLPMAVTVLAVIPESPFRKRFTTALLLSIAFAANIGGTATLIGSPPNIQMSGILADKFQVEVDFMQWMSIGLPFAMLLLGALFFYFKYLFLKGDTSSFSISFSDNTPLTHAQKRVMIIFSITVVLWMTKQWVVKWIGFDISDTQIALIGGVLLFLVPAQDYRKFEEPLLGWEDTKELPWGILLLFGGGLALASCLENGGVLSLFADWVKTSGLDSYMWLLFILIVSGLFLTELMSNLALVTILIPIVAEMAVTMGYPVLAMCIPITLAASCAFMLPMATPPNAIVFSTGELRVGTMVKVGFVLNVISVFLITLVAYVISLMEL